MKPIYLLIIILFLNACQDHSKTYQRSEHSKIAERITAKTVQKIEAETGLRFFGIGGGMMNHVRMMAISFEYFGEVTMEQGRELLVYCMDEYLSAINASEEIRPYLIHSPFTPKDIEIEIFIRNKDRRDVSFGALCVLYEVEGVLKYKIKEPDPVFSKQIHKETYEEAVKILETQGPINKIRKNIYYM